MDKIRIAIDGPSGAGKSTVAKELARILGIDYLDTGAMYRAGAYKLLGKDIKPDEVDRVVEILSHTDIDYSNGNIILDGEIVNDKIRTQEISSFASDISAIGKVREILVALQKKMGSTKSIIMDGRDIGTVVMTDAEYKFFVTASLDVRAKRRWLELRGKGIDADLETVKNEIEKRDNNDSTREVTPLRMADDAVLIDGTNLTVDETVGKILAIIEGKDE
ncbi:MAG: (d)CMP kinase [Eubacteriales bacterium]